MIDFPTNPTAALLSLKTTQNAVQNALQFKVGQIVQAQILDITSQQIRLQIGRQVVIAQPLPPSPITPQAATEPQPHIQTTQTQTTPAPQTNVPGKVRLDTSQIAQEGRILTLKVIKSGDLPVLHIVPQPTQTTTDSSNQLKNLLPKQLPTQTLLNSLTQISNSPTLATLPQNIQQALTQLLRRLPSKQEITTTAGVQQAVQHSGLFFEHRLLDTAQVRPRDFKTGLLLLLSLLNQSATQPPSAAGRQELAKFEQSLHTFLLSSKPPLPITQPEAQAKFISPIRALLTPDLILHALKQVTQGVLSRLQVNQLAHRSEEPGLFFNVEIPIFTGKEVDLLQVQFEQEGKKKQNQDPQRNTVTLALNLAGLGPLHAKIVLLQDALTTTFWAEQTTTAALIQHHLPKLYHALEEAGFVIKQLNCYHGTPPPTAKKDTLPHILDERI